MLDVIFVHPKDRYYVVWHQGQFWQLPRLSLTASAWSFRLLYKGELGDIFVAKNQHISDSSLAKRLTTTQLPAHLSLVSAERFLPWWHTYHRRFSKTTDTSADDSTVTTTTSKTKPKTIISPYAKEILAKTQPATPLTNQPAQPTVSADNDFAIFDELLQELQREVSQR